VLLFFNRYDSDQDGRLGFWELSNALLPIDIRQRDEVEQRQGEYKMSP
jgi:Ca2+-binding EF-hand superfamily protein